MSDRPLDPYPGLAAPAFGGGQTAAAPPGGPLPVQRPACSNPRCANPTAHPGEPGWQQLVSAVPVERQLYRLRPKHTGTAFPTEADFRSAVGAVRPEHADAHSLERLRNAWSDGVAGRLADWSEQIETNLADLSEGWPGPGFAAFAAACVQARELVEDLVEDIDATAASLRSTEEALYTLQGGDSGEIPYPAPQFWIDGDWHSWVSVHIRPAWWRGDCIEYTCRDAEHALALGGADPELATEIIDYIDERIVHYVDSYSSPAAIERDGLDPKGLTVAEAKELAVADAMEQYGTLVDQSWGAYEARHGEIDEDIGRRSADTDGEERSLRTVRSDKGYPAAADPAYMDLRSPPLEQPTAPAVPLASEVPSLDPPSGAVPEEPSGEDGERPIAGLAGGFDPGAVPGPLSSGTATIATAVLDATAAGAAASDLRAAAGLGGPVKGRQREPGLAEDENVWGLVDEDDDPYA